MLDNKELKLKFYCIKLSVYVAFEINQVINKKRNRQSIQFDDFEQNL